MLSSLSIVCFMACYFFISYFLEKVLSKTPEISEMYTLILFCATFGHSLMLLLDMRP